MIAMITPGFLEIVPAGGSMHEYHGTPSGPGYEIYCGTVRSCVRQYISTSEALENLPYHIRYLEKWASTGGARWAFLIIAGLRKPRNEDSVIFLGKAD